MCLKQIPHDEGLVDLAKQFALERARILSELEEKYNLYWDQYGDGTYVVGRNGYGEILYYNFIPDLTNESEAPRYEKQ